MYTSFPKANSHISNSFEMVNKLSNTSITDNMKLISLDVVSLFMNIPIDMAMDSISNRWQFIMQKCSIPQNEFLLAVRFILESTFFVFSEVIYKQTFGTPMGSPLSPIIADIVLQDLEKKALNMLKFTPSFYLRYVDDIILMSPPSEYNHTLTIFNSFHPRLQFTIETEVSGTLNFLDLTLILNNNHIHFDWFHKSTFSGRYLNFFSQHPMCQKRGTIIGLVDRAISLSHPIYHKKNLELCINVLLMNCYPLDFIFETIQSRLHTKFKRNGEINFDNTNCK